MLPRNLKGWSWGQRKWVYKQFLQSHFREVIYCARFLTKTCLIFVALITKIVLAMMTVFVVLGVTCNWRNVCNGGKARGLFSLHLILNTFNDLPHSLGNIDFFTDFPSKTEIIYYIFIVCWLRYSWRLQWPFQIALSFNMFKVKVKEVYLPRFNDWKMSRFRNKSSRSFVPKDEFLGKIETWCWTNGVCVSDRISWKVTWWQIHMRTPFSNEKRGPLWS